MSVRETIWFFGQFDADKYVELLNTECSAIAHPGEPCAYIAANLPFYEPVQADEFTVVVGFNKTPLPGVLIDILVEHPELVSDDTIVLWLVEQEVIAETTIGGLRNKNVEIDPNKIRRCRELAQAPLVRL